MGTAATGVTITWPSWVANTTFAAGARIKDSNGNIQQVFITNPIIGPFYLVSGSMVPTWNVTTGALTPDGTGFWINMGPDPGTTGPRFTFIIDGNIYGYATVTGTSVAFTGVSDFQVPFGANSVLQIVPPDPQDATLADVTFTLLAVRTD